MSAVRSVALIGLGLIGSSIARAARAYLPDCQVTGYDRDADVRARAANLGFCHQVASDLASSIAGAELIILCVPVGAVGPLAAALAPLAPPAAIISDVGSSKTSVVKAMADNFPMARFIPAHPVAGTEESGPDAGFASLFSGRWCILTPDELALPEDVARVRGFWEALGSKVDIMDAAHHDMVLAVTSHLPHLIAYTIVGTASDLEDVTQSEVIKYSAGGFRDFTRIAASDPVMWRDVFLANKEAVLAMLQRFSEDLTALQRAIRWDKGDELFELFSRTRAIRRSIIAEGQDEAAPDFGRTHK
jgi:cyclohexadieny/prephenate dehydrogenase